MAIPATVESEYRQIVGVFADVESTFYQIDTTELTPGIIADLIDIHGDYFAREAGPDGESWRSLAASTINRKGHDQILFDTGRLFDSLEGRGGDSINDVNHEHRHTFVTFGTEVPYSHFHQTGTSRMAKREHVGLAADEPAIDKWTEAIADMIVEGLKK